MSHFSSPHLVEARERIRIDGKPLEKEKFVKYFWQCMDKLEDTLVSLGLLHINSCHYVGFSKVLCACEHISEF